MVSGVLGACNGNIAAVVTRRRHAWFLPVSGRDSDGRYHFLRWRTHPEMWQVLGTDAVPEYDRISDIF